MRRKDATVAQDAYKKWWMERHRPWLVNRLGEIFTPRARLHYKAKLTELYQLALKLQPQLVYKVPGPSFPEPVGIAELPENLQKELEEDSSDEEELLPLPSNVPDFEVQEAPGSRQNRPITPPPALGPMNSKTISTSSRGRSALQELADDEFDQSSQWPFVTVEGEAMMAGGYSPLTGHVGRAWLLTARRRLRMLAFAEEMRQAQPLQQACGCCGVTEEDPYVMERVGAWEKGAQLRVQVVVDLQQLVVGFEQHHGVPPLPFDAALWEAWINRHDAFTTMCCRCIAEQELEPSPLPAAWQAPVQDDSEDEDEEADAPRSPDFSEEDDRKDEENFPGLNTEVSHSSREMIIYWALVARRRVRQRQEAAQQRLLEGDDESSESEGSELWAQDD